MMTCSKEPQVRIPGHSGKDPKNTENTVHVNNYN